MKKYFSFIISSRFGFFRKPELSKGVSYSYNWIPLTSLYGLIGACIGLNGYHSINFKDRKTLEYMSLKKLIRVGVIPIDKNNNLKLDSFDKEIIVYNTNLHNLQVKNSKCRAGFAQCREQTLINPKFKIIIEIDETKIRNKLKELNLRGQFLNLLSIRNYFECPIYTPYFGKNEFMTVISDINEGAIEEISSDDEFAIESIFLKDGTIEISRSWDNTIIDKPYIISEFLPYDYNSNLKYQYKEFFVSNNKINILNEQNNLIKIVSPKKATLVYLI